MPVTGEIAELPLPELLNMMRHRAGKLTLLSTGQITEMVLHFSPGYLCGMQVGNRTLKSEVQVVDKLVAVTASPMGRFIFEPQKHASSLLGSVRMGVDRLALILVSRVDEISVNKAQLPPAHCVFRLHLEAGKPEFEDVELAEFFRTAESLLYCGISAEKLATIEQTAVEQVQLYFYKLQLLNLIARARRDDQWARLDNVLETKSTPLRVTAARSPSEKITPRIHADPTRPSPPPWAAEERIVGFGGMEQRKVTRLTGPPTDDDDELTPSGDDLPPAA